MIAPAPPAHVATPQQRTVLVGTLRGIGGRYRGGRARVRVVLTGVRGHRFAAVITTRACRGLHGCPAGRLRGTWSVLPVPHDAGETAVLSGSGTLRALGRTRARGQAQGTGFVMRGRPSLGLTLTTARGTLALSALGPRERPFTPIL